MTMPYQQQPSRKDLLPLGTLVQINTQSDDPRSPAPNPSGPESTTGIIRGAYTAQGYEWYTVVWDPGGQHPTTGEYKRAQLNPITNQQQAQAWQGS